MNLRKYKRCYCRVISGLEKDPRCRFVSLTSSPDAINPIQRDFRRLTMRLKRRHILTDYIRVIELTQAGVEHVHMIYRGDYIDQCLLSHLWNDIHQSPVVDIRKVWGKRSHYKRVAGYLAKEMSKQGFRRYSWSWGWVYRGFALVWRKAKHFHAQARFWSHDQLDFGHFLDLWHTHLKTHSPPDQFLLFLESQATQLRMSFFALKTPSFVPQPV
ncbi:MAG: hypothetical protein HWN68_18240 [Desulfobacterales bacterium]|nr:hypothetical protein [Desulfobacterales bacterium]